MIINGKHTEYRYFGGNVIYMTTDTGFDSKSELMYLAEDSSNPLSVLSIVCRFEKSYALA